MTTPEVFEKIIIPIASVLLGAIIGALAAHQSQRSTLIRNDKKIILAQLMGGRHIAFSDEDFTKALNMIPLIFHDNKLVKDAYHQYLLFTGVGHPHYTDGQRMEAFFQIIIEMGKDIGYNDLTRSDIRDYYIPELLPKQPPSTPS